MKNTPIDISHLNKAGVLAALYNASRPLGMGFLHFNPAPMTLDEAEEHMKEGTNFDYLKGRVMKVNLNNDTLDPWGFDRYNGEGAAERAINAYRLTLDANAPLIQQANVQGVKDSAASVRSTLEQKTTVQSAHGIAVVTLGLNDVSGQLGQKVNEAIAHSNQ